MVSSSSSSIVTTSTTSRNTVSSSLSSLSRNKNSYTRTRTSITTTKEQQNQKQKRDALISRMIKAGRKRLNNAQINEAFISSSIKTGQINLGIKNISQLNVGKELGRGSFSSVYEITQSQSLPLHRHNQNEHDNNENTNDSNDSNDINTNRTNTNINSNTSSQKFVVKVLREEVAQMGPSQLAACTADLIKEGAILASLQDHKNILSVVAWTPTGLHGFYDRDDENDDENEDDDRDDHDSTHTRTCSSSTRSSGRSNSYCCAAIRHDSFFLVLGRLSLSLEDQLKECRRRSISLNTRRNSISITVRQPSKLKLKGLFNNNRSYNSSRIIQQHQQQSPKMVQVGVVASFQKRLSIVTELADVIHYIHSKGIIHRDLKPDNIGFDDEGVLKLFDFDVARRIPNINDDDNDDADSIPTTMTSSSSSGLLSSSLSSSFGNNNNKNQHNHEDEDETQETYFHLTQHVGTPRYMSPECAQGLPYNAKVDVYAFGLLCYELLTLQRPYANIKHSDHYQKVFLQQHRPSFYNPFSTTQNLVPTPLRHFIKNCWSPTISHRPTMKEAFHFLQEHQTVETVAHVVAPSPITTTITTNTNRVKTTTMVDNIHQRQQQQRWLLKVLKVGMFRNISKIRVTNSDHEEKRKMVITTTNNNDEDSDDTMIMKDDDDDNDRASTTEYSMTTKDDDDDDGDDKDNEDQEIRSLWGSLMSA